MTDSHRHAFMIMAHADPRMLASLLALLDDERNDIYLHVDARNRDIDTRSLASHVSTARFTLVPSREVNWGGFSQIQCELSLLTQASKTPHLYYHLLSGSDLPIVDQDRLHEFFAVRAGAEFIHFVPGALPKHIRDRMRVRRLFSEPGHGRPRRPVVQLRTRVEQVSSAAQNRLRRVPNWRWGSQWFSITEDFAQHLLTRRAWIIESFGRTVCADEHVLQTVVVNSPFVDRLHVAPDATPRNGSARLIDWARGDGRSPHVWQLDDLERLRGAHNEGFVFARKFNSDVDRRIIDEVVRMVSS